MLQTLLPWLACPDCRNGPFEFLEAEKELQCTSCQRKFAIEDGIVCLLPHDVQDSHDSQAKAKEQKARDEQASDYDRMVGLKVFGIAELPLTLRMMRRERHGILAEIGCGTGRMTSAFAERSERVIALDFSRESLRRCKMKLEAEGRHNVLLVQGDATRLPLREEIADQVVSCQVLEHVPSPEARSEMIAELKRIATKAGSIVISAYKHSILTKLFAQKEGEHDGGIYYFRFSRDELRDLVERQLKVRSITGVMVYHYLVAAEKA